MGAGYSDQFMEQGATFNVMITLDDDLGMGINLTNFSVNSQARKSYYSANASIVFNTSIFDAANGVISLYADANTTSNVVAGNYVYDVKVTDLFVGSVTRVLEGRLFVTPGVTR